MPKKKSDRKLLDTECRRLLRSIVILRDKGCITPSDKCRGVLQHSHYHSATKSRIKYDLRNVHCQCEYHNQLHSFPGGRGIYEAWMNRHYPQNVILELAELASLVKWKWTISELYEIRDNLAQTLKELEENNGHKN